MNVTICPPAPARHDLHFDKTQFIRPAFPVEATYVGANGGENGWVSTGLSFDDYNSMRKETHRSDHCGNTRKLAIPDFMLDAHRFRAVVIRFMEIRVQVKDLLTQTGTEVERLQRLTPLLKYRAELAAQHLDRFCAMYVAATDDAERQRCQRRIEEFDTTIRICREPWVIPAMARAYHCEGLKSSAVGRRIGFKAPHVRQILHRLKLIDQEMQEGGRLPNGRRRAQGAPNLAIGARQDAGNESAHV
jgi:hypothetical protein